MELDFNDASARKTTRKLFLSGRIERRTHEFLMSCLKPGMTFVDVGANWGYYSLTAAKKVGSAGQVIAFEPDPCNASRIRRNLGHNRGLKVVLEQVAISDATGEVEFHLGETHTTGSIVSGAHGLTSGRIQVTTVTLDEHLDRHGITSVDVLKMDIQALKFQLFKACAPAWSLDDIRAF